MFEWVACRVGRQSPTGFHVPLADELAPMHRKCVAGGCSRASGSIYLWWRQLLLLHFTKSDRKIATKEERVSSNFRMMKKVSQGHFNAPTAWCSAQPCSVET